MSGYGMCPMNISVADTGMFRCPFQQQQGYLWYESSTPIIQAPTFIQPTTIDNDVGLAQFINYFNAIHEDCSTAEVTRIIPRERITAEPFFKWETAQTSLVCVNCMLCEIEEEIEDDQGEKLKCAGFHLSYYVQQWQTGTEGDSYAGYLVYPLIDYYVEVRFDI